MVGIRIPVDSLSEDALQGLVQEYVTRDGTELTDAHLKVEQVLRALGNGRAEIWFDDSTSTCTVRPTEQP